MNFNAASIICKSVGALGVGAALYDSAKLANKYSKIGAEHTQGRFLEKAYFESRTLDDVSYVDNAIREKTFDLRSKNPIPSMYGGAKGGLQGFLYGLGHHLPLVCCSMLALACKKWAAKAGAIGVGLCALYRIARDGFGLGKHSPMD